MNIDQNKRFNWRIVNFSGTTAAAVAAVVVVVAAAGTVCGCKQKKTVIRFDRQKQKMIFFHTGAIFSIFSLFTNAFWLESCVCPGWGRWW